jgi:uncharacterized RDD family membrane protein YckC
MASVIYETVLLAAVLWTASALFTLVVHATSSPWQRMWLQTFLLMVAFAYFAWCWIRGGQTLAMKTWHLRLLSTRGTRVTLKQSLLRFFFAFAGIGLAGFGLLWALIDRERQFLHDRLAGTMIVRTVA